MRKVMNDVFLHYVFETERHCGISDLLEIWGSIINGFAVPLKEEHKLFLTRVLIPLHKTKGLRLYHKQLSYCVSQFIQKEPALELVENIDPDHYRRLALPLCTQITRCLSSCNSQVAERALNGEEPEVPLEQERELADRNPQGHAGRYGSKSIPPLPGGDGYQGIGGAPGGDEEEGEMGKIRTGSNSGS
ncbi:hypothetical protein SLEP1_g30933 [Rubroshorea leprosula]|uniref:Uncharacterized protein n=1 Tax=Rubroshorea leprosula TaxID=152421 RepID=A0AAV5K753_9ROSI|nr:hypothetical protein SLEP1_g30933 [Rubroshorea leprosula]